MKSRYSLLLPLIPLAIIGAGLYFDSPSDPATDFTPISQTAAAAPSTAGSTGSPQAEYADPEYHFKLSYPSDLAVQVYPEDDGARTVVFTSETPGIGFQVYVTPYDKNHIDDAQFRKDMPSGVMKDPQDIRVDGSTSLTTGGVPAKIFYGRNDAMGDTREVWFIKGGYLYEVTTYKALDTWLGDIMLSWRFI